MCRVQGRVDRFRVKIQFCTGTHMGSKFSSKIYILDPEHVQLPIVILLFHKAGDHSFVKLLWSSKTSKSCLVDNIYS
jgi:hypothetical protein